uniref:UTP--glucose-1-phosphate uridylyltransferase n=1 Tax=Heligmosomoides polygyrus TaxID=6339 RepID=A0A183F2L4_HELPZ
LIDVAGQLMHLEIPQVPPEHLDEFCSTRTFKIFNTNNIWVNLKAVKRQLEDISSEIIVNRKVLNGQEVIQLETSIGGCIRNFRKAYCKLFVRNFHDRFDGYPDIRDLNALVVDGNVRFEKDVVLKGDVRIVNKTGVQQTIVEGTTIDNGRIVFE